MDASTVKGELIRILGVPVVNLLESYPKIYAVGGVIRDLLLHRKILDVDLLTDGISSEEILRKMGSWVHTSFQVNDRFQTRRAILQNGCIVDFTELAGKTLSEDIRRRDFTLNALVYHFQSHRILDEVGGLSDLRSGILRMIQEKNFEEDPLRLLRAYRLRHELGFTLDRKTEEAVRERAHLLPQASPERLQEEFHRLLRLPEFSTVVRELADSNLLFYLFPCLKRMKRGRASPVSSLTVLEHTFRSLQQLENILQHLEDHFSPYHSYLQNFLQEQEEVIPLLRLALLFHDSAKPITQKETDGDITYYGHDVEGARLAEESLTRLRFPKKDVDWVATLVRGHLRIGFYSNEREITPRKIYRFFKEFGEKGIALILHSRADLLGYDFDYESIPWGMYQKEISRALLCAYFEQNKVVVKPPKWVTGKDLIEMNIPAGPAYRWILEKIEEGQVEGRILSRENALSRVKALYEEYQRTLPSSGEEGGKSGKAVSSPQKEVE